MYTLMFKKRLLTSAYIVTLLSVASIPNNALAAWFESQGQAAIYDGNIEQARQTATQEAIRQALLFAGASVKSVQTMANGVLKNDDLIVRANGEVNSIELVSEVLHDDFITVAIRADIFPQRSSCDASNVTKSIVTAWYPMHNRMHATTGGMFSIGEIVPHKLDDAFETSSTHADITKIFPTYQDERDLAPEKIMTFARRGESQYVLLGSISDLSVNQQAASSWQFWQGPTSSRQFGFDVALYDGFMGTLIWEKRYHTEAPWTFNTHSAVDLRSATLWQSEYGNAMTSILDDVATNVSEQLACETAYGRILTVENEKLTIDIGQNDGLKAGDEMTLFQVEQRFDANGKAYRQFNVHPTRVSISEVFAHTATAISIDGSLLANIQANDYISLK